MYEDKILSGPTAIILSLFVAGIIGWALTIRLGLELALNIIPIILFGSYWVFMNIRGSCQTTIGEEDG